MTEPTHLGTEMVCQLPLVLVAMGNKLHNCEPWYIKKKPKIYIYILVNKRNWYKDVFEIYVYAKTKTIVY